MLQIASLNSGSNGNCYYIGNATDAVLVDAGLSCRETEKRMERLGFSMHRIKAIFISHEHSDHIKGIQTLSAKYRLPVYITEATCKSGKLLIDPALKRCFVAEKPEFIGELSITGFQKFHDAADPHSFIIKYDSIIVGVFTDIGTPCKNLVTYFKQCHAAFLESNYDEEMLQNGGYPYHLKKRITGGEGHLSNKHAYQLYIRHRPSFMSHLILSHLSQHNNCPELVNNLFSSPVTNTRIIVASRHHESEIFSIYGSAFKKMIFKTTRPVQMKLFEEFF
jgi:phosphoribosyl 1,2-cyclic phosphodiesterase